MQLSVFSPHDWNECSESERRKHMSIVSEINRIKNNIAQAYDRLEENGADLPEVHNSANLPSTVDSLQSFRNSVMKRAYEVDDTDVADIPDGQIYERDDKILLSTPTEPVVLAAAVPDYVENAVETLAKKVQERQTPDTITFIAASDFHLDLSNSAVTASQRHAVQAIGLLSKRIKVDFIAGLGDFTWCMNRNTDREEGVAEISKVIQGLRDSAGNVPLYLTTGNHDPLADARTDNGDGTYSDYVGDNYIDSNALYPMIGIHNPFKATNVLGYGYVDFSDRQLRVICLNTSDSDVNINTEAYTDNTYIGDIGAKQAQWFADSLDLSDKSDCKDWKILIVSHHPLDWGRLIPIVKILKGYEEGASGVLTYTYGRGNLSARISYDYAHKDQAKIIAQVHGHLHNFRMDSLHYLDGLPQAISVNRISVPNACFLRTNHVEGGGDGSIINNGIEFGVPADGDLYKKVANTANDTAFSIITVDLAREMMYIDNYGAGYDRELDYYTAPDFENLASDATDGVRLNSSGGTTANQYQVTGDYISVSEGDSILFGGADWYDDASRSIYCSIYLYDSSKNKIAGVGASAYPEPQRYDSRLRVIPITSDIFPNVTWNNVSYARVCFVGSSENLSLYCCHPEQERPDYMQTNLVPLSTDDSGNVYNTTGYRNGYRLASAGTEAGMKAAGHNATTGYIPVEENDILHFGGGEWISDAVGSTWGYSYVYLYDVNKSPIGYITTTQNTSTPALNTDDYGLYAVKIDSSESWTSAPADFSNVAFARITLKGNGSNFEAYTESSV